MTTIPSPQPAQTPSYGMFEKTARFIGDLDHDLYNDPAQGQAWNEASAVGFQLTLISGLIGSGAMFLFGGPTLFAAAVTVIALTGVIALITVSYAVSHGVVMLLNRSDVLRPRNLLVVLGFGLHGAAILSNAPNDSTNLFAFVCGAGLIAGVFAGLAVAAAREQQD